MTPHLMGALPQGPGDNVIRGANHRRWGPCRWAWWPLMTPRRA